MVWKDIMTSLNDEDFDVTEAQVRWAITSGKIDRPSLDGSLRFIFEPEHLDQLRRVFSVSCSPATVKPVLEDSVNVNDHHDP